MINDYDKKFMAYALNLSKKNLGLTSPNPVVGCVLVNNKKIISSGVTKKSGRPHAERVALDKVKNKEDLNGATAYVTLEPCSHFGQTSPCVEELIKYKFKKVVIAVTDPDSRVNGQGIAKLKAAGIEVLSPFMEEEAKEINRGFFKAKLSGLPFITLKIATSLDGKIATKNFDSKWITNEKSRQFSHFLRAKNDAILIGGNTLRKDNPSLDCRILGLEEYSPKVVIISRNAEFDANLKVFQNSENPPIILSNKLGINFKEALQTLFFQGINSVLVEGGAQIATQFLQQKLVDELVWIRSPKIIGNDGVAAIGDLNFLEISKVLNGFTKKEVKYFGDDVAEIFGIAGESD